MTLTPGSRLGVFELIDLLGRGGMGEVYRATDTKLKRQVAIKILPPSLVADHDRLARFQREAEVLASLNHPNIAAIYGLEESAGVTALVMELVEGDDLSQRIARGAIPLDEALPIAKQIAEALEAAHEQGIIHRDLKPANIKVHGDGTVKVLDFGLAKAIQASGSWPQGPRELTQSPTITTPAMTQAGMILGTAAYMSPEQARGKTVDKRADIWAFGAVLYEMLAGKRAFTGDDVSEALVSVMRDEPDWSALPLGTPATIRQTLRMCLQKDPRRRVRDVADVRLALDGAFELPAMQTPSGRASVRDPLMLAVAGIAAAATVGALLLALRPAPTSDAHERLMRLSISSPSDATLPSGTGHVALSPDGNYVVFGAVASDGRAQLWLRALDRPEAQPVNNSLNTAGGWVFWSPDSRSFGFGNDGKLRIVDVATGRLRVLSDSPGFRGGTWAPDDTILFAASEEGGLLRVTAEGGKPVPATTVDRVRGERSHRMPWFLPDGRHFVYRIQADKEDVSGIYLGSLTGDVKRRLLSADSQAVFVPQGFLLYVVDGTLFAHRFDVSSLRLDGAPTPLAQQVAFSAITSTAVFSASASGALAYRTGAQGINTYDLQWFDRRGTSLETLKLPSGGYANVDLSVSGKIAVQRNNPQGTADVWVIDSPGSPPRRVTFGPPTYQSPMWSPDEQRLLLFSLRPAGTLFTRNASGQGDDELVVPSAERSYPGGWSPDGKFVVYATRQPETNWDLYVVNVDSDREPQPFARSAFNEQLAQFSPDGHWIAYTSDESSANEVYVQAFPASDRTKVRVSTAGGSSPRWRRDGRELFYMQSDRTLMAVDVTSDEHGVHLGAPHPLFSAPWMTTMLLNPSGQAAGYAPSADGQRFLMTRQTTADPQRIDVVLNWPALLGDGSADGRH